MAIERQSPLGEVEVTGVLLAVVIVAEARRVPLPVQSPISWLAARPSAPTSKTPSAPTVTGELTVNPQPRVLGLAMKTSTPVRKMTASTVEREHTTALG